MRSYCSNSALSAGSLAVALAALLVIGGCAHDLEQPPARHLVVVTLDTTRADRLGCYGRQDAGTPTIDALAERGTLFERAYAQTPLTLPSHVSIFTGMNPPRTAIHVNGQEGLPPGIRTLAELLAENGFFSVAAVGGYPVAGRFPVSRGFAMYDDRMVDPNNPAGLERDAAEVVAAAMRQLDGRKGARLFMWVHFFDPHDPYTPPPPFADRYADDPYQGEIARVDSALAELLGRLRSRLGSEEPLICVVGDHGEALGDHGEPTHGFFLYESSMRVPFVLAGPRVPRGRQFSGTVRTVDILPTLLKALDLPIPAGLDGGAIDLSGEGDAHDRPVYIETELPYRNYGWSPLRGVIDGRLKYIAAPRPELYDIRDDPDESRNLAMSMPQELQRLDATLADFMVAGPGPGGDAEMIDPRLSSLGYVGSGRAAASGDLPDPKDRLHVYLRFTSASRFLEEGRPGRALPLLEELVRDEGTIGARLKRAQAWRMLGRLEEAEAELLRLEREDPSLVEVKLEIARIALWTDRASLALDKLEEYLASFPGDAEALMFRGAAREMLGDAGGAEADYRRALALNPAFHGASLRLGALLVVSGRTAEARSHLAAHLKSYPGDDIARGLLESL